MQQRRSQQQQPADSRVTAKAIVAIIRRKRMEGIPLCWVGAWVRASHPCDDYLHKLLPLPSPQANERRHGGAVFHRAAVAS